MNINDTILDLIIEKKNKKKTILNSLNFNHLGISIFNTNNLWSNIQYLSLRENYIKSLSFLKNFPNLFYLDLNGNPLEDYGLLNKFNTFGFLSLTAPENYLEKKILIIKKLNVAILHLEIKKEENYYLFIYNNPNIIVLNNKFISFKEKLKVISNHRNVMSKEKKENNKCNNSEDENNFEKMYVQNTSPKTRKKSFVFISNNFFHIDSEENRQKDKLHLNSQENFISRPNPAIENSDENKKGSNNNSKKSSFIEDKFKVSNNVSSSNNMLSKLINYIKNYNKKMIKLYKTDGEEKDNFIENVQKVEKSNVYKIELERLFFLSEIYQYILKLNIKNENYLQCKQTYYQSKKSSAITRDLFISISHPYIDISLFKVKEISKQIIILSIILIYILGILPREMCHIILLTFYTKYKCKKTSIMEISDNINLLLKLETFYLISIYFDIYKHLSVIFKQKSQERETDFQKYKIFLNSFKMYNMIGNLETVITHQEEIKKIFRGTKEQVLNKNEFIIENYVSFFKRIQIFNDTLIIINFLNDFLIHEKYEEVLIKQKENSQNFQIFLQIKEIMFKSVSKNKMFGKSESIAEKLFNDLQIRTLSNKYYFKNENTVILTSLLKSNILYSFRESTHDKTPIKQLEKSITSRIDKKGNDIQSNIKHLPQTEKKNIHQLERSKSIIGIKYKTSNNFYFKPNNTSRKPIRTHSLAEIMPFTQDKDKFRGCSMDEQRLKQKTLNYPSIIKSSNNIMQNYLSSEKKKNPFTFIKGNYMNKSTSEFKLKPLSDDNNIKIKKIKVVSSNNIKIYDNIRKMSKPSSVKFNINKISFGAPSFKFGKNL